MMAYRVMFKQSILHRLSKTSKANQLGIPYLPYRTYNSTGYTYSTKKIDLITPLFIQAEKFGPRTALIDQHGRHTYDDILHLTNRLTDKICDVATAPADCLMGERVAVLCPNDVSYVVTQWSTWMSGGVAVPLCPTHPNSELQYFIEDSQAKVVVSTEEFAEKMAQASKGVDSGIKHIILDKEDYLVGESEVEMKGEEKWRRSRRYNRLHQLHQNNKYKIRNALIVYTSGTTGRPKGVVHTFGSLQAHIDGMVEAWEWSESDVVLHVLPLHHVHGIINVLMTPLYVGAKCVMMPKFEPKKAWTSLLRPTSGEYPWSINVFMAVPTVYAKMLEDHDKHCGHGRMAHRMAEYVKAACTSRIRLMGSGSAALPRPVMDRWRDVTGHTLLERYGMTETGMVLTNPLRGSRIPGAVGKPFPRVEVCIAKANVYADNGYDVIAQGNHRATKVTPGMEGESGELYVKGPYLFKHYWNNSKATKQSYTKDGWFKTGDTAIFEDGVYKIMGRTSVDIIKSGGYKISALDIEHHLLEHEDIMDIAVVGLPDLTWGQKVAGVIVLKSGSKLTLDDIRTWSKERMPPYWIPTVVKFLEIMPRNSMGKVNKKELLKTVFEKESKMAI